MERKLYWIYILKCWRDKKDLDTYEYYPGYTERDVGTRFDEHLRGRSDYTKKFEKLELVYFEKLITTKALAIEREGYFKKLSHKKIDEMLENMPRTKGTRSNRNKRYDKDKILTAKLDQFQHKFLETKENKSEHIRDLIGFSMWLDLKGRDQFNKLYILCDELSNKYRELEVEIFTEIFNILNNIAKRINPL